MINKKQAILAKNSHLTVDILKLDRPLKIIIIIFLFSIVFISGLALRLSNFNPPKRSFDELIYLKYTKAVYENGIHATKINIEEYNSTKKAWIYPSPIRIGYIYLNSAVMKAARSTDIRILSYVSSAFSIISLFILVLLGLRFFNPWITLVALLFMSVSPMDLAIAMRAWQDGIIGTSGLLLIYFCCEISENQKRKIWYIFFWIVGGYSILIKESGILIYALCVIWLIGLALFKEKSILKILGITIISSAIAVLSFFALASVSGGAQNVISAINKSLGSIATNRYNLEYQSGPWYSYFQSLFILSPVTTLLSGLGMTILAFSVFSNKPITGIKDKRYVFLGLLFFISSSTVIVIIPKHMINLRYISVLFVPFYLMSGMGLWYILLFLRSVLKNFLFYISVLIVVLIVIIIAINNCATFDRIFTKNGITDLSIGLLKKGIANK